MNATNFITFTFRVIEICDGLSNQGAGDDERNDRTFSVGTSDNAHKNTSFRMDNDDSFG